MSENNNNLISNDEIKNLLDKNSELVNNLVDSYIRIKQQNNELVRRNSTLEQSLGDKDSSFYELVNQKSELELKIHSYQKKYSDIENILKEKEEKISQFLNTENELLDIKSKYNDLENQYMIANEKANVVNLLNEEIDLLKQKNAEISNEKNKLIEKVKNQIELEKNLTLVSKELSHKNLLLNDRAVEIEKLKGHIAELDNSVYKYKNIESELENQIKQNQLIYIEFEEYKTTHNSEYSNIADINTYLKKQIAEFEEKSKEFDDKINLKNDEMNLINSKIIEYQNTINDLNNEISKINQIIDEKNNKIFELDNYKKNIQDDNYNNELAIKEIEIRALIAKVEELENTSKNKQEDLGLFNNLEIEYDSLKNEYNSLKIRFDELVNSNENNDEKLQNIQNEYKNSSEKLNLEIVELNIEINNLRNENDSKSNLINENNNKINELKQIIKNISEETIKKDTIISDLKLDLENDAKYDIETIEKLNYEKDILKNEISMKNDHNNDLEEKIRDLTEQNTRLDFDFKNSNIKIQDLENLLKTRYEQIDFLENQINHLIDEKSKNKKINEELVFRIDEYIKLIDSKIS